MRLSVVHLRVLMIVLNLGLATGLAYFYVDRLFSGAGESEKVFEKIEVVSPTVFKTLVDVKPEPAGASQRKMALAAIGLSPEKPREKPVKSATDDVTTEEDTTESEEAAEGGPLAEDWEFVWCIRDQDDPLDTLVMLRKKDAAPRTSSRTPSRTSRTSRSIRTRRTPTRSTSRGSGDDTLFFRIRDRRYNDEDAELDFYLVSCDLDKFVYGIKERSGKPLKLYSLSREAPTHFGRQAGEKSIVHLEPPKDPNEKEEDEDEEKEEKLIVVVPKNVQDLREKEFQALMSTGKASSTSNLIGVKNRSGSKTRPGSSTRINRGRPGSTSAPTSSTSSSVTTPKKSTGTSGPITDPKEKAKAVKELTEGIKDIPKDKQEQILKELNKPQG